MVQHNATATVKDPAPEQESDFLPYLLTLDFNAIEMTDEQFVKFCADNGELRIELTAERELIIMPPAFPATGMKNSILTGQLYIWSKQDGTGVGFDSSAGFTFPNGAIRSPDTSWITRERWDALAEDELTKFAHIAPDFVAELRSHTDSLRTLQDKMAEYIGNGVRLGWLIDPSQRRVYVYRPGQDAETLEDPASVSGENVMPGFVLNLQDIW